ncbi:MAG TPA: NAD(P)H-dependent oxidoreductase [Firmicutes bacterium]|nr:NAD(P)H-dependent oxidoreductase [Bacillota bacterium]
MSKILVAYFSASGVTASVAQEIANAVGADLYEIRPVQPYTAADLDWTDKSSRSTKEMDDPACRPAVAEPVHDMAKYDTVFVGFPIWWYVEPRIVDTFMESYDFSGKRIIPFATSGGSGIEKAEKRFKSIYSGMLWEKGRLLNGLDVKDWAKRIIKN